MRERLGRKRCVVGVERSRSFMGAFVVVLSVFVLACGEHEGPGEIQGAGLDADAVKGRVARQAVATDGAFRDVGYDQRPRKQVLFGDLHVHTTFSADAFLTSLAVMQGDGTHPPADACDYARYCSALDFWSINDHAEALSPRHWAETKESIRECNARAGDRTIRISSPSSAGSGPTCGRPPRSTSVTRT